MKQAATGKKGYVKQSGHYVLPLSNGKFAYRWKDRLTGKMKQKQFRTKAEAEIYQRRGKAQETQWGQSQLSADGIADAKLALQIIKEKGLDVTLVQAVQFWAERKGIVSISWGLALTRYFNDVQLEKQTQRVYNTYLKIFPEEMLLTDLTANQIETEIERRWGERTRWNAYQTIRTFLNWCKSPRQRLISYSPLEECKVYEKPVIYKREIWKPEELIKIYESFPQEGLLYMALSLGAGLRNPEALAFSKDNQDGNPWELHMEICPRTNEERYMLLVPAHATKTQTARTVRMEKTPFELVRKYRDQRLTPDIIRKCRTAFKQKHGYYKDNAGRHTYASGAAKTYGDNFAADYCGNSVGVLRKHYRNQISGFAPQAYAHAWNTIGKREEL